MDSLTGQFLPNAAIVWSLPAFPLVFQTALHKKWNRSAKGAEYESQGQVPSKARHVAPGCDLQERIRPEGPKSHAYYALSALDQIA